MSEEEKNLIILTKESVDKIWKLLDGHDGKLGLAQKVDIMWAGHIPIITVLSLIAGALVQKYFGLIPK